MTPGSVGATFIWSAEPSADTCQEGPVQGKNEQRAGLLSGIAAYGLWGVVPLFWPLLKPSGAIEILAHRMVWSLGVVAIALLALRRWSWIGELVRQPRSWR